MAASPKIAITGGTGFVGRHLIANMVARGIPLVASYHQSRPSDQAEVRWLQLDLSESPTDSYHALGQPDVLIHLAWGELSNYRSSLHLETELPRQRIFLKSMIDQGLQNLVVAGTCFEYGLQEGEQSEGDTTAPHLPYCQAKDQLRQEVEAYCDKRGANFTWLRLFYLFGEDQPERSLYPQFRHAVQTGQGSFDMSPGDQERDYLSIETASGLMTELALQLRNNGVVNICSGQPVSVRSLVEHWRNELGSDIELNLGHYPYPDWEPMSFWGSTEKLYTLLGKEN